MNEELLSPRSAALLSSLAPAEPLGVSFLARFAAAWPKKPSVFSAALFVVVVLTTTQQSFMIVPQSEDEPRGPITHEMSCNRILFRIKRGGAGNNLLKSLFG